MIERFPNETLIELSSVIIRMSEQPTNDEIAEDVHIKAIEVMKLIKLYS